MKQGEKGGAQPPTQSDGSRICSTRRRVKDNVCVGERTDYFSFQGFIVFGTVSWCLSVRLGFFCFSSFFFSLSVKYQQALSTVMTSPWREHGQASRW